MNRAGQLLVAHPSQTAQLWRHSVIYITEDHSTGTVGLMLNKASTYSLREIMASKGLDCLSDRTIYTGGPVTPTALVMIHSGTWWSSNTLGVSQEVSISSDTFMLEKLAQGDEPLDWRIVCGVSSWAPHQLEDEINRQMWLTCSASRDIIYEWDGDKQWHKAIELCSSEILSQFF